MRVSTLLAVPLMASGLVWAAAPAQAATSVTFTYTGSAQTWTVPAGVSQIDIDAKGAGGGGSGRANGGSGARVQTSFSPAPGDTVTIKVGGGGSGNNRVSGGGVVGGNERDPGAGGGSTVVSAGAWTLVAGAGGGAYFVYNGGSGGLAGQDGTGSTFNSEDGWGRGGQADGTGGAAGENSSNPTLAAAGQDWNGGVGGSGGRGGAESGRQSMPGGATGGAGGTYADPLATALESGGSGGAGYGGGGGGSAGGFSYGSGGGGSSYTNGFLTTYTSGGGGAGGLSQISAGSAANPGGDGSVTITYTVADPPTVTGLSPSLGSTLGGTALTITGTGFAAGEPSVTVGGASATLVAKSATELVVLTPPGVAGAANVVVTVLGQTASASGFEYGDTTSCSPAPAFNVPITCTGVGLADVAVPAGAVGARIVLVGGGGASGFASSSSSSSGSGGNGAELDARVAMAGISTLSVRVGYGGAYGRGGTYTSVSNGATPLVIAAGGGAGGRGSSTADGDVGGSGAAASTLAGGDGAGALGGNGGSAGTGGTAAVGGYDGDSWASGGAGGYRASLGGNTPGGGDGYGGGASGYITTGFSGGGGGAGGSYVVSGTSYSIDPASGSAGSGQPGTGGLARAGSSGLDFGPAGEPGQVTITFIPGPAPTVSSISPSSGARAGGTNVTITGTGFQSGATVTIGGASATSVTVVDDTQITAVTPVGGSAAANVVVTNVDTQFATLVGGFVYDPPTITSLSSNSGTTAGGQTVTATGTGFIAPVTVTVGGASATNVTVLDDTSVSFDTPAGSAGAASVVLTSVGQTASTTYTYVNPPPAITSFTPSSGSRAGDDTIVITGSGFLNGATVSIGGANAISVSVDSSTQITAVTPAGTSPTAAVVVTNTDAQSVTAGSTYAYVNPSISSLNPTSGTTTGGTTVTINGAGLAGASGVTIGGHAAAIVSNSGTQIVITTPAGGLPGPESLAVTVAGTTASSTYNYTAPAPAITSINPTTGSTDGGTTVTITGTDLGGVTSVTFALTPAIIVSQSATQIVVLSPAGVAGVAQIVVADGAQTASANFTYTAPTPPTPPTPTPARKPGPPRDVTGIAGDRSVTVAWVPPASTGSFAVTAYEVQDAAGQHTCMYAVSATQPLECEVTGLTNGREYAFRVRALSGAGWGEWSTASEPLTPASPVVAAILIAGERDSAKPRRIVVEGITEHMVGRVVSPWLQLPGQRGFRQGSARITIGDDGAFTWARNANKKVRVYFSDGVIRSNVIRIPARK